MAHNDPTLSQQIRDAVNATGKSRVSIANDLEISEALLSRFMSGQSWLSIENLDRLGAYLGLRITTRARRKGR